MKHPNEASKGKGGGYANTSAFLFAASTFEFSLRARLTKLGERTKICRKFENHQTKR